jgi:GNAT superfamily N-acetyltransferase
LVLDYLQQLAAFLRASETLSVTEEQLREILFEKREAEVLLARHDDDEVGFALFFPKPLVWSAQSNMYLEDIYVKPEFRGRGFGKAMMQELARIACERGCRRIEWMCYHWNQPSIDFYHSIGAYTEDRWAVLRLDGEALEALASE